MTDFNDWYAKQNPDLDPRFDDFHQEARKAFEAGAASQAGTLRDEFAGRAMGPVVSQPGGGLETQIAEWSYRMADAMIEARKTTTEDRETYSESGIDHPDYLHGADQ
ncbi:hypothetical protein DB2_68 [Octadecabacter Antarctic DB virus 2]|nr:hypothetical protein DB2_68 [Octadecabacter Antarctic DB virus 2]